MSYRDRPIQCPRCTLDLVRSDEHDRWRCTKCSGMLFAVTEVIRELVATAPDLVPEGGVGGLTTRGRHSKEGLLTCSLCGAPMEPVFLGGVDVDRCYHDEMLWFDRDELARVVAIADEQRRDREKSWLVRLLTF